MSGTVWFAGVAEDGTELRVDADPYAGTGRLWVNESMVCGPYNRLPGQLPYVARMRDGGSTTIEWQRDGRRHRLYISLRMGRERWATYDGKPVRITAVSGGDQLGIADGPPEPDPATMERLRRAEAGELPPSDNTSSAGLPQFLSRSMR